MALCLAMSPNSVISVLTHHSETTTTLKFVFNCTSMLNEGSSPRGFSATKQQQQTPQKSQNRGAALSPANTVLILLC